MKAQPKPRRYTEPKTRDEAFGKKLCSYREKLKLTQTDLGKLLGVTYRTISSWETGASYLDVDNLKKLTELYLQKKLFEEGQEREQMLELWNMPRFKYYRLDEAWLEQLLVLPSQPVPVLEESVETESPPAPSPAIEDLTEIASEAMAWPEVIQVPTITVETEPIIDPAGSITLEASKTEVMFVSEVNKFRQKRLKLIFLGLSVGLIALVALLSVLKVTLPNESLVNPNAIGTIEIVPSGDLRFSNFNPSVSEWVTATFTVKNVTGEPITLRLAVSARQGKDWDGFNVNFPDGPLITLQPGETATYHQSRQFQLPGEYFAEPGQVVNNKWGGLCCANTERVYFTVSP